MLCNLTKGWYLCCHKHHWHKYQCISKYLFLWKHLSIEREFNNQSQISNYCSKAFKETNERKRYSEAASKNHIGILRFWAKSLKNTWERVRFWQFCRQYACSFTKKGTPVQALLTDFAYRFSWQNYIATILKKPFQSEHF